MTLARLGLAVAILLAAAACPAAADDASAPGKPPHAVRAQAARPKPKPRLTPSPNAGIAGVTFSDPDAPPVGLARAPKPALAPYPDGAQETPGGGASLALKWHADNEHIDNPLLPPWIANGQGYNVQAGVKLGF